MLTVGGGSLQRATATYWYDVTVSEWGKENKKKLIKT
jgi:hypothetical protein